MRASGQKPARSVGPPGESAMRLLLDGVAFQNAHQRGIQRYFTELIARLPAGADVVMLLSGAARAEAPSRARVVRTDLGVCSVLPRGARPLAKRLIARPMARRLARSRDVFHSTYYTRSPSARLPGVLTVFDMIAERFPDSYSARAEADEVARKREAILGADRIITISQHAAGELAAIYPEVAGRTIAIPLGHEHALRRGRGPASGGRTDRPYALFVGDRAGYKNFRVVLEGIAERAWPRDLALLVVGSPWREDEEALIAERGVGSRLIHRGRVGDDHLTALYAGAACVIVPSLAEGFGFPVVEAQAAGAPVVCSDIPVFREVAGEAALFFDPRRPDALASRLAESLNPATTRRLLAAGDANLPRFSWAECARRTWGVYLAAVGRG
jgi:glycosyltransferase involved in cell wall biosynthesis